MKRSEMVDKIQLLIESQSRHGTSFRIKALEILDIIEFAEMSPPDWNNTVYGWNEGNISPPEWEPEND